MHGRVVLGKTGGPYASARLQLSGEEWHPAIADENGRFVFRSLKYSEYTLYVTPPEETDYVGRQIHVEVPPENANILVELPMGQIVTGSVVDEASGDPVAGVKVRYHSDRPEDAADEFLTGTGVTDEKGRFRLSVPPGKGFLKISGPVDGYALLDEPFVRRITDGRFIQAIDVMPGQALGGIQFAVGRGLVIDGLVTDPEGKPVAGADVKSLRGFLDPRSLQRATRTDDAGRFTLSGFTALDEQELEITHRERRLKSRYLVKAGDERAVQGTISVAVRLKPTATVSGRVLVADKPLPGAALQLIQLQVRGGRQIGAFIDKARTDAKGRFVFDLVETGEEFYVSLFEDAYTSAQSRQFVLQPGQAHEVPVFEVLERNMPLSGIVVDPDGNPVEGVTVSARMRDGMPIQRAFTHQPTGTNGRFTINGLPNVPLTLIADILPAEGPKDRRFRLPTRVDAEPGQQDVRILLEPTRVPGPR